MKRGLVDLRHCSEGDILITALGGVCRYDRPTVPHKMGGSEYLDHRITYLYVDGKSCPVGQIGTRTHDGHVFAMNRIPETDHDIVLVIPKDEATEILAKALLEKFPIEA